MRILNCIQKLTKPSREIIDPTGTTIFQVKCYAPKLI